MPQPLYFSLHSRSIGTVLVDGSDVRGDGGPHNPQLVVPLTVQLNNQTEEPPLAIARLHALLGTDQDVSPVTAVCPPVSLELFGTSGFQLYSRQSGQHPTRVELRFVLTVAQLAALERRRHTGDGSSFSLYVSVHPTIVGLQNFNEYTSGQAPTSRLWDATTYGMYSELAFFWAADPWPVLRVDVPTSTWVRQVLPRLGYDRVRLIEVNFPPPLEGRPNAADRLDAARAALDACRYEECVAACRDVLEAWERHLGASRAETVASVLGRRLGWLEGDPRREFIDGLWKTARDITINPNTPPARSSGAGATPR